MKVLMLAQFYPPTLGGEEHQVRNLSIALAARGYDVCVATLGREGLEPFVLDEGVRVIRIPSMVQQAKWLFSDTERRHAPPFPDPIALLALRDIINREQPDIVHAHNWLLHSFLPLKSWSGAKLIVTLHDYSFLCATKRLMKDGLRCNGPELVKCLRCAAHHYGPVKGTTSVLCNNFMRLIEQSAVDLFLPVSEAVAIGSGLIAKKLPYQLVSNFLPDPVMKQEQDASEYLKQLPEQDFLLFVGDLGNDKGVHVLLRAYAKMRDVPPLVLIGRAYGDTPLSYPPNVYVFHSWPHFAVLQAWQRCLFALAPSIWAEPFGLVVIEAMAAGCAVVASRIGGIKDIVIDHETGLLVPPGDEEALCEAIQLLLANPGLRQKMGAAAQQRIATRYLASVVVPEVEQIYQRLLQSVAVSSATVASKGV